MRWDQIAFCALLWLVTWLVITVLRRRDRWCLHCPHWKKEVLEPGVLDCHVGRCHHPKSRKDIAPFNGRPPWCPLDKVGVNDAPSKEKRG